MTGALILLVTLLLFGTLHDPYFPQERLISPVPYLHLGKCSIKVR